MEDKIILTADDGTEVTFYVIEETRLGASNYLLVADSDDEDAECLILKDTSRDEDPEANFDFFGKTMSGLKMRPSLTLFRKYLKNSFLMRILPLSDAQKM